MLIMSVLFNKKENSKSEQDGGSVDNPNIYVIDVKNKCIQPTMSKSLT